MAEEVIILLMDFLTAQMTTDTHELDVERF